MQREASTEIVVIPTAELQAMIKAAVREELAARGTAEPSEWIDVRAAGRMLGVGSRMVQRLASSGDLPSSRVGRRLRLRRVDVEAYLARRAHG
jgi:excisionase family DNA binding protein